MLYLETPDDTTTNADVGNQGYDEAYFEVA